jgi:hypothetical protein
VGVKGRKWSKKSHRKLNISIWVPSIYMNPPKDLLSAFCGGFFNFLREKKNYNFFENILATALKSYINDF